MPKQSSTTSESPIRIFFSSNITILEFIVIAIIREKHTAMSIIMCREKSIQYYTRKIILFGKTSEGKFYYLFILDTSG